MPIPTRTHPWPHYLKRDEVVIVTCHDDPIMFGRTCKVGDYMECGNQYDEPMLWLHTIDKKKSACGWVRLAHVQRCAITVLGSIARVPE